MCETRNLQERCIVKVFDEYFMVNGGGHKDYFQLVILRHQVLKLEHQQVPINGSFVNLYKQGYEISQARLEAEYLPHPPRRVRHLPGYHQMPIAVIQHQWYKTAALFSYLASFLRVWQTQQNHLPIFLQILVLRRQ